MSKCRSCGAEIVWAKTGNGKQMPVDVKPDPKGNVELMETAGGPFALVHRIGKPSVGYLSHFVTCPNAKKHRKK